MLPHFELFDHTADMGIRVVAPTMPDLIKPATDGLYAVIGELVAAGSDHRPFHFTSRADGAPGTRDPAVTLRDYLSQVLYLFEHEHRMLISFEQLSFSRGELTVRATSAPIDPEKCVYFREVKAITYHELSIVEIDGGFEARFIVDI